MRTAPELADASKRNHQRERQSNREVRNIHLADRQKMAIV
jgi:hypothetical protein